MLPETSTELQKRFDEQEYLTEEYSFRQLQEFIEKGEYAYLFARDDKQFTQFVEILGHDKFDPSKVLAYYYVNHDGHSVGPVLGLDSKQRVNIQDVMEWIADSGSHLEFVNDFTVRVLIALDNEASALYEYEMTEQTSVCDDCAALPEYEEVDLSQHYYNCDHNISEYDVRRSIRLTETPSRDEWERYVVQGHLV